MIETIEKNRMSCSPSDDRDQLPNSSLTPESTNPRSIKSNSKPTFAFAAKPRWRRELFHEYTAVRLDHALRRNIIRIGCEIDITKPLGDGVTQHVSQGLRRVPSLSLPRDYGVTNMAKTVRRERFCPGLPAKPEAATEFSVPHPSAIARN